MSNLITVNLVPQAPRVQLTLSHEGAAVPLRLVQASPVQVVLMAQVIKGEKGDPGVGGAFMVSNRFLEIAADETAKQAARDNLGVSVIDGGTFF